MRSLRILLLSVLVLLALLVGGLAGFWWLAGPEAHRWMARRALEVVLDREVHIDGTLEVELGTAPALSLTDLRIDNPPWAAAPTLLRIERAEIQIALRPLLRRILVFPRVALEGVSVDLETAADGRHSWELDDAAPSAPPQESFAFPLFESLAVGNATVTYHDQRDGQRTQVHITSLTEQRDEASGGMRLDVNGEINGNAFQIRGKSGSLEAALMATNPYPVELDLQLPAVTAEIQGTIADAIRAEGLDLHLGAQSPSLRAAAQAWNLSLPADAQVTGNAQLTGDLGQLSLTDLAAEMTNPAGDHLALSGSLGNVWDGSGLNMMATVKLQPEGAVSELLPADWHRLEGLEASARLGGSILAPIFEQLSADLQGPGDSSLKLAGTVQLAITDGSPELDRLDVTTTLAVPEPSAWVDLLGFDLSALGALRGEARLTLADQQIEATDLTIDAPDFGALQLQAQGVVGMLAANRTLHLAPNMSFTAEMADSGPIVALIDTHVPELRTPELGALAVSGRVVGDDQGYRLEELELELGGTDQVTLNAAGSLGPLVTEDVGAAEVDLTVRFGGPSGAILGPLFDRDLPELGVAQGAFGLHGTVADLRIEGAELETKRDDGVVIMATGGIEHVGTVRPPKIDGVAFDLDARAPSTTVAAQLFGHDLPDFGAVHARARLGQSEGSFTLSSIDLRAGSAQAPGLHVTGAIDDMLALEKVELAGAFEIPTADLLALVDIHGKAGLGTLHGKVELSDGDGSMGVEHLEAAIRETDLLALTMDGLIDDLEHLDQIELETSLDVSNIGNLAEVFGLDAAGLEQFRFDGQLSEDGRQLAANGTAVLGETQLVGKLAADFRGARPSFKGRLYSPHLRLVDMGLKPEPPSPQAPTSEVEPHLFSPDPFPLEGLLKFDLDLEVQLDGLEGLALAVDQAKAHVKLTDGALQLSPLRFDIVGGHAEVDAEVDARDPTPKWRVHVETDDVQLGDLWRQLQTDVPLAGELDLVLDLQASGRSPRDLASSLDGDLNLALQRGKIASRMFGLTTMGPLRWLTARSTRRGYSEINCFVAAFHAENGVAELDALVLDTPDVIAAGEGKIDFSRETLDLRITPEAKQSRLVEFATPFAIRGDLANPTVETSTTGATARLLGRVAAGPVNLLGSLLPFVNDRGGDADNPCLKLSDPAAPKS